MESLTQFFTSTRSTHIAPTTNTAADYPALIAGLQHVNKEEFKEAYELFFPWL